MNRDPTPTLSSRPGPGRWLWSVVFVALSVVALAVVPILLGQRMVQDQNEAAEVLEPARLRSLELSLLQARQFARFQAYLLTGDRTHRDSYLNALPQEDSIYAGLSRLGREMELEVREQVAELANAAARWHLGHNTVFGSDSARLAVLDDFDQELTRYSALQEAALELQEGIQGEVEAGRARMAETQSLRLRMTLVLVLLALGATLVVAFVGRHLLVLTAEAEARRKDAVRARREIDALLEATGDGVLGIDLEGRCIALNRAGSELLGWTERELRGRDVHETLHHTLPDGTARLRRESPILEALREGSGKVERRDDVLWRRDGTSFPARWTLQPMVDGLETKGAVLTITDMTVIRETEEALRRAVHARDEVVSIVSHDLKNPLGVVSGAAELLLDLPLERDEREKQVRIIKRSADRMARLVRDLLDVARLEAGALTVHRVSAPVGPVLDDLREEFAPLGESEGVALEVEVPPGVPPAYMDPDRIHQALANLVGNAMKFTPRGGTVRLAAAAGEEGEVVLRVTDDGPGIAEDQVARLFDRFWQASRDDRTGSGLGLAIVKGIVDAHHGRVEVESRLGEGSAFTLRLPAAGGGEEDAGQGVSDVRSFLEGTGAGRDGA